MAGISQRTTGYMSKVFYKTGAITSPVAKPTAALASATEIKYIQNIADIADTAATVTVNEYAGDGHTITLAGIKTVAPYDLVMNYVPTEHDALKTLFDSGDQFTMQVQLIAGSNETYVNMNANILSFSISNAADGVRSLTCSIGVIGGIAVGHKA